jgi:glycosyltransferase involved in cell wall biosynthesis
MKTVIITDTFSTGHHLTYIQLFTQILLQLNYRVLVLCPNPNQVYELVLETMPIYISQLYVDYLTEGDKPNINIKGMSSLYPTFSRWFLTTRAITKAKKKFNIKPDLVLLNWLDGLIYLGDSGLVCQLFYILVELLFPYKWVGVLFHSYSELVAQNPEIYRILRSKKCQAIAVLNEHNLIKLSNLNKKIVIFPDVADDTSPDPNYEVSKEIKHQANSRKIIGLLGHLEKRKGILSLIEIAKRSVNKPWFFFFAGVFKEESFSPNEINIITDFIKSNPSNCFFHLKRIPYESQFNALIQQCDLVYVVYDNFPSSSNLLTKAAIFSKPVLVAKGYCMESRVKEFNLGVCVDSSNIAQQINALETLLGSDEISKNIINPRFLEYKEYHSVNRLKTVFIDFLSVKS